MDARGTIQPPPVEDPRKKHGRRGERLAAWHLRRRGCRILARNYRCPHGEIDLIALDGEVLVFVEVKSRTAIEAAQPESNYQLPQQRRAAAAAQYFLMESGAQNWPSRFDLVSVHLPDRGRPVIDHFVGVLEAARRLETAAI